MSIPFIAKTDSITFLHAGRSHTLHSDDLNYNLVLGCLKRKEFSTIEAILNNEFKEQALNIAIPESKGLVVKEDGTVTFKGELVKNSVVDRIKTFITQGLPFEPLVKFLENLMENPSFNSRTQLYDFLEHNDIPITEDGCFFGYKAVRRDGYDKHSGTIHNEVGKTITMDRSQIDDNPNNHCSSGLHVGAIAYVTGSFASGDDIIYICKVNPRDVVSVPNDHEARKLRTCEYTVTGLYTGPLNQHLYTNDVQSVPSTYSESYDELKESYNDWDDDEENEDDETEEDTYDYYDDHCDECDESFEECRCDSDDDIDEEEEECFECGRPFGPDITGIVVASPTKPKTYFLNERHTTHATKVPVKPSLPQRDRYGRFLPKK